mmetsp:Transcript_918/g.2642  ORF Transcript_918/g.2642 Transcript_918/m.2642 type:complete len:468 (-) Transcript_918:393-1796(-)
MMRFNQCLLAFSSVAVYLSRTDGFSLQVPPDKVLVTPQVRPRPDPDPLPSFEPKRQTAVILNTNARSVSPQLAPVVESVFGSENVFLTTTAEEAQQAVKTIVSGNYSLVVPVGGDGTLSSMINYICDEMIKEDPSKSVDDAIKEMPAVGYIPLGTGNGLGFVVGCRVSCGNFAGKRRKMRRIQKVLKELKEIGETISERGEDHIHTIEMPIMEVTQHFKDDLPQTKGDLCFFAGVGFDSLMLNDFKRIKAWAARNGFLKRSLSSVAGYCVALIVKTLPKCVMYKSHKIQVELTTRDYATMWIDHRRGDFAELAVKHKIAPIDDETEVATSTPDALKSGKLLFSGTTGILAAGTSPFYGGGMRLFPYARLTPDKMHLRLGRINPLVGFVNIPKIFEGSYREKSDSGFGCIDFIGDDFEVEVKSEQDEKGFPFQHSGESVGNLERFRLRVAKEKIKFVSLLERRIVVDD